MKVRGKRHFILYLEDWQIRLVKDFTDVTCTRWMVELGDKPVVKYGVPDQPEGRYKRMYLTEWQKRELKAETGEDCEFIEIRKGAVHRYGVQPD